MVRPLDVAGQVILYAVFALALGVFSRYPPYHPLAPDEAMLKLSFSHPGQIKSECRQRDAAELQRLPPNMRIATVCPRERSEVSVELRLDGRTLASATVAPAGWSRDGPSTFYGRYPISAGPHRLDVRFKDSERVAGYTHQRSMEVHPRPGQILVVDFNAEQGGIVIQ